MTTTLPIEAIKPSFLAALKTHQTLILSAPPGAGKSTRLPLWLLDLPQYQHKKIYLLQPRRIAAKNIACYLAQQLGEPVGQRVGYRLKNDSKVSKNTQLEVITEGILTQIIQHDPELLDCALIVLDEFHERSIHADLAFALSRDIQQGLRDDLTIVLMSATLASGHLLKHLPDAIALKSEGRSFPVDISYQAPTNAKYWRDHALSVIKNVGQSHQGSILVFLPGVADIHFLAQQLKSVLPPTMLLSPLYGDLSIKDQQQALQPAKAGLFKLVLATNIAETSLTIEGVDLVIDCGLEKVAMFDRNTLTNRLEQKPIAKASAIQRAGRAGRLTAGQCIRLYSFEDYERRAEHNVSEIKQADIIPLLIEAARWGVNALTELPLLEFPAQQTEIQAWQVLQQLELVDGKNSLTKHGKQVAKLPCHPRFAHMIIRAKQLEAQQQCPQLAFLACLLAALLEERDLFSNEQARNDCDLSHRVMQLYANHKPSGKSYGYSLAAQVKQQAQRFAKQVGISPQTHALPTHFIGILLALAYPERLAQYRHRTGQFLARNGKGLLMNEQDALADARYIVAAQLSQHNWQGQPQLTIRLAAEVDINTLVDWQLLHLEAVTQLKYDKQLNRISAKQQDKVGALVINEQSISNQLTQSQVANMWVSEVEKQGLKLLPWQDNHLALLARWRWLNSYQEQLNLPDVSEAGLLAKLSLWFAPYVGKVQTLAQLKKLDLTQMLLSLLDYQQQQLLSSSAPTHFNGPTGRKCPIRYGSERSPTVSLPMQELYGVKQTPVVGVVDTKQQIPLILELLSPAKRPIQITQDLVSFWQGSYRAVQKDMKSQYPKHYWPDDPANAKATNKVKRLIKDL